MLRFFLCVSAPLRDALLAAACLALVSTSATAGQPNVLLIMADDLGFSDLGCYGGEIHTPHLDLLAAGGLCFTQFYNTGRCWPTRSSLLTGFYAQQIGRDKMEGIEGGGGQSRRPDWAGLVTAQLGPLGYRNLHVGKWHIDGAPLQNGFDRSYYLRDQHRFFNPTKHSLDGNDLPPVPQGTGFYATTHLGNHALAFLDQHEIDEAGHQPFFLYLAFAAPHFPLHALPKDIAFYDGRYDEGWDVIRKRRWERIRGFIPVGELSEPEPETGPPYAFPEAMEILGPGEVDRPLPWDELTPEQRKFQADKMEIHAAMIHAMDREIGRVLDKIRAMGEFENTLVMFLSDNGASAEIMVRGDGHDPAAPRGSAGSHLCLGPGWSTACNTPFRKHKTWTHEGGIRTPFIAHWPAGISARGEIREAPSHVIDIAPTLLDLAGGDPIENSPGHSLRERFADPYAPTPHEQLWWHHDGHRSFRIDNWKLSQLADGEPELYHLLADPTETTDLSDQHPERVEALIEAWEATAQSFRDGLRQ